ncbi:MAG: cupin domain-containing protein [Myxococcota bacterium]
MSTDTQEVLIGYMLGDLQGAALEAFEARLEQDPELQRELDLLEETLCTMSDALEPMEPSPDARHRLMDALDPGARFEPWVERAAELLDLAVDKVRALFASIDNPDAGWILGPADSELLHLPTGPRFAGVLAGFARVKPGVRFPYHKHNGREIVLVLQGALHDSSGRVFRAGDESIMDEDSEHDFVALDGPPLIYMVTLADMIEFDPSK